MNGRLNVGLQLPDRPAKPNGYRVVDLCAATGLFSHAFALEGFEVVAGYELDPEKARAWGYNHPHANGYAVNRGEWRDSVWAIGAPIRDSAGTVVAALGISGPSSRIKPGQIKPLALLVRKAADAVSRDASTRPADD